jgi:hypothetical protein
MECLNALSDLKRDVCVVNNWAFQGVYIDINEDPTYMTYVFNKLITSNKINEVEQYFNVQLKDASFVDYLFSLFPLRSFYCIILPKPSNILWRAAVSTTLATDALEVRIAVDMHMPIEVCKIILHTPAHLNKKSILFSAPDEICRLIIRQIVQKPFAWRPSRTCDGAVEAGFVWSGWKELANDSKFREYFHVYWAPVMAIDLRDDNPSLFGGEGYVVMHRDRIEWIPGQRPAKIWPCVVM